MPPGSNPATCVAPTSKVKPLRLKVEAHPPATIAWSKTSTLYPLRASRAAAVSPPMPPPITVTRPLVSVGLDLPKGVRSPLINLFIVIFLNIMLIFCNKKLLERQVEIYRYKRKEAEFRGGFTGQVLRAHPER